MLSLIQKVIKHHTYRNYINMVVFMFENVNIYARQD